MSLARYYDGKYTIDDFNEMQRELRQGALDEYKLRCHKYKENIDGYKENLLESFTWLKTDEDVYEHFDGMLEQDIEMVDMLENKKNLCEERAPYTNMPSDFLYHNFTRSSSVTRGPVFEMFYYNIDETFDKLRISIKTLFEYPYYINDFPLEDMCFYKDKFKKIAVCSHEGYAFMELSDDEYNEFLELKIEHDAFIK